MITMTTRETIAPLTINTRTTNGKNGVFSAAAFQYTEEPAIRKAATIDQTQQLQYGANASPRKRASSQTAGMSVQSVAVAPPTVLYVRALYDYEADDRTSLSFRQGDTIQVITQLASGWWDGIIHGVRGWFPSNYCAVINGPVDTIVGGEQQNAHSGDVSADSGTEDEGRDHEEQPVANGSSRHDKPPDVVDDQDQEVAAFWIPQATPDGRLFYFNTLTGVSTMELPLETPTSANEPGPLDRLNVHVPGQTRAPPEMLAGGIEREDFDYDEENSASEIDGESLMLENRGSRTRRRRSYISDGVSPSASSESLEMSPNVRSRGDSYDMDNSNPSLNALHPSSTSVTSTAQTSFLSNPLGQVSAAVIPRSFFDDGDTAPLTWNKLVENMRRSVELYRQAINNSDRSEYVRRAEDISDHLRMLLAAASGTTDNHSGNPSIISTNKALYPHFRDMMSRFSKLVLSSHIAAADWPSPDSYSKCLQEAEGVLHGVYGYVEVARSQRGEEIPRLTPGFVLGSSNGGSWQNNNLATRDPMLSTSFMDQDEYEPSSEPSAKLDANLLERLDDLKRMIVSSIRRLEEQLAITEKLITPARHERIGNSVCAAASKVIDYFRPWISTVESIDLAPLGSSSQTPQINEFTNQKQRLYDLIMHLLIACQTVAAPLGDEWAESRGDPLEDRLNEVRTTLRQLEALATQIGFSLQVLHDMIPLEPTMQQMRDSQLANDYRRTDSGSTYKSPHLTGPSRHMRSPLAEAGNSRPHIHGLDGATDNFAHKGNSKAIKFFGEVPAPMMPNREIEETPYFLKLDYEGEIAYDMKANPPQLRGGTLIALVEQLTRHDKLDAGFNNTFLLTYKSFTTAPEFFEMLVKRFSIQPPRGISEEDYKTWVDKKQKPIRFRVVNILKSWFDSYWMENADQASEQLLRKVYSFAKDVIATTSTPGSGSLMAAVELRLRGQDTNSKRLVPTTSTAIPPPIMPKNMKKLKFLDIDATEFARQLTIIESRLYGKIKPTECLNKTWQKKVSPEDPEPAANVKALILHSNQLTNWVAEMILNQSDVKKRVVVIKHFVQVAEVGQFCTDFVVDY